MLISPPCLNDKKELAILGQTTTGKESTNPLMVDSLVKTIMSTKLVKPQGFNLRPNMVGNGSAAATSMDETSAHIASSSDECRVGIGVSGIGADFVVNDAEFADELKNARKLCVFKHYMVEQSSELEQSRFIFSHSGLSLREVADYHLVLKLRLKRTRKFREKHERLKKQNEELKNEIYQLQADRCKAIFRNEQTKSQLEEKTIKRDEDVRNLQKLLTEKECASQELKCKRVDDSKRVSADPLQLNTHNRHVQDF
ncbi:hypothetical protein Tco_1344215 [Tanacetum coccineum]